MAKKSGKDKNYISIGQWILLHLLFAIPCIGFILLIVLAFVGENQTRKNYCRAAIILLLVFGLLYTLLISPIIIPWAVARFQQWQQKHHWHF
jgi:membrane protein YdbS with pleckstrin-like domain